MNRPEPGKEMALVIAEHILGYDYDTGSDTWGRDVEPVCLLNHFDIYSPHKTVESHVYSPDAFWEVWDVLEAMPNFYCIHLHTKMCRVDFVNPEHVTAGFFAYRGEGFDRFDRLYEAVWNIRHDIKEVQGELRQVSKRR